MEARKMDEQRHDRSAKRARRGINKEDPTTLQQEESLVEFNDCFIVKRALSFVGGSLTDVGKVMLVCRSWRNVAVACEHLWTLLLLERYPNLKEAHELPKENARNIFLRRLQLDRNKGAPIRVQAWPKALRTPPARLVEMWKPKSILFLVDVHIDSVHVVSESRRVHLEQGGSDGKLLVPVSSESHEYLDEDGCQFISFRVDDLQESMASAAERLAKDSTVPCKVFLSFQLEGDHVPSHHPIALLSEHEWTMKDWRNSYLFQTDVSGHLSEDSYEHYLSYEQKKAADDKKKKDICRYDTSPLPFDPVVDVCISPHGSVNTRGGILGIDCSKDCILQIGIEFNMLVRCFPTKIFPTLLSLCEDATR